MPWLSWLEDGSRALRRKDDDDCRQRDRGCGGWREVESVVEMGGVRVDLILFVTLVRRVTFRFSVLDDLGNEISRYFR